MPKKGYTSEEMKLGATIEEDKPKLYDKELALLDKEICNLEDQLYRLRDKLERFATPTPPEPPPDTPGWNHAPGWNHDEDIPPGITPIRIAHSRIVDIAQGIVNLKDSLGI